jgi:hypothetical protein
LLSVRQEVEPGKNSFFSLVLIIALAAVAAGINTDSSSQDTVSGCQEASLMAIW